MPVSSTQLHGKDGALRAGGVTLYITEWSADHQNDIKEGTTTYNAGFKSWVKGLESISGSFKAIWDTSQNPYVLSLTPGTLVNLELRLSSTSYYSFQAMLKNISPSMPVQDLITYSCNFESNGTITTPT